MPAPALKQDDVDALWRTVTASIARNDLRGAALAASMMRRYVATPGSSLPRAVYTITDPVHEGTARAMICVVLDLVMSGGSVMRESM